MASTPLVSVIIPCYNYEVFIHQALESLQAQTYQNWECIVVDDGSTDNTRHIVTRWAESDARIKYFYQKNQGLSAARNTGIKNSAGQYVQFLDADDLIEERKIERHVEYLEQHPEVDIIYGNVRYFRTEHMDERLYVKGGAAKSWMTEASGTGKDILLIMTDSIIMPVNAALMRRSVVERVGYFDETLVAMEDWDYWRRCAVQGVRFQYQSFEGTLALVRDQPLSMSKDTQRMITAFRRVQEKLRESPTDAETARIYQRTSAYMEGRIGIWEITDRKFIRGVYHLFKAGIMARKIKWLAYAFVAPLVSKQQIEKIISLSTTQFIAGLRPSSTKLGKESKKEEGKRVGER